MTFASCGTGGLLSPKNIEMLVETGVYALLVPAVDRSLEASDKQRAFIVWSAIAESMDFALIPIVQGEDPQIKDLEGWFDKFNLWDKFPVSDSDIRLMQMLVNTILSYIPTEKLNDAQNKGKLSADMRRLLSVGFTAARDVIRESLKRHGYISASLATGAPIEVPERTLKVKFSYARSH